MDKPFYLGFATLLLSKLHVYEPYYDKVQPYFGRESLQLHYIHTDRFVFCVITKDNFKHLENLEEFFDLSNLNKNHELLSNKNKRVIGKFKIETPKNLWID